MEGFDVVSLAAEGHHFFGRHAVSRSFMDKRMRGLIVTRPPGGGGSGRSAFAADGIPDGKGVARVAAPFFHVRRPRTPDKEPDMGRRTQRTESRNKGIADRALANLAMDQDGDAGDLGIKHRRSSTESRFQKSIKPKTPNQAAFMKAIRESVIAFGIGPAGTGKTFMAARVALDMLARNQVSKVVLSRPAMEAEGERIGFLPGTMEEKLHPYMLPIYDILSDALGRQVLNNMIANGTIELCPLAFMRGRTFNNAAIVLDEMQNATAGQMKMALTRIGENSRAIVTGDPGQSDLDPKLSGLRPCARALAGAPGVGLVSFGKEDVVRSEVVSTVLEYLGE
jgi:phosphate starvation-inducible PhoH-like protein